MECAKMSALSALVCTMMSAMSFNFTRATSALLRS